MEAKLLEGPEYFDSYGHLKLIGSQYIDPGDIGTRETSDYFKYEYYLVSDLNNRKAMRGDKRVLKLVQRQIDLAQEEGVSVPQEVLVAYRVAVPVAKRLAGTTLKAAIKKHRASEQRKERNLARIGLSSVIWPQEGDIWRNVHSGREVEVTKAAARLLYVSYEYLDGKDPDCAMTKGSFIRFFRPVKSEAYTDMSGEKVSKFAPSEMTDEELRQSVDFDEDPMAEFCGTLREDVESIVDAKSDRDHMYPFYG